MMGEACSKVDYLESIVQLCQGISRFQALTLFYDLSEQEEEMMGDSFINKLNEINP